MSKFPAPYRLTAADRRHLRVAISRAIRDTEALVDAHLGSKYTTPRKPMRGFARVVAKWKRELSAFRKLSARLGGPADGDDTPAALKNAKTVNVADLLAEGGPDRPFGAEVER